MSRRKPRNVTRPRRKVKKYVSPNEKDFIELVVTRIIVWGATLFVLGTLLYTALRPYIF